MSQLLSRFNHFLLLWNEYLFSGRKASALNENYLLQLTALVEQLERSLQRTLFIALLNSTSRRIFLECCGQLGCIGWNSASESINRLHGGNELGAVLIKPIATLVHRFTRECHDTDGLG